MRALIVLAALGWLISRPWMAVFGYIALIVIAIAVLWLISVSIERRAVSNSSAGNTIDANYVTALKNMVVEAEAEVEKLRAEIERLRAAGPVSEPNPISIIGLDFARTHPAGWSRRPAKPIAQRSIPIVIRRIGNRRLNVVSNWRRACSTRSRPRNRSWARKGPCRPSGGIDSVPA